MPRKKYPYSYKTKNYCVTALKDYKKVCKPKSVRVVKPNKNTIIIICKKKGSTKTTSVSKKVRKTQKGTCRKNSRR